MYYNSVLYIYIYIVGNLIFSFNKYLSLQMLQVTGCRKHQPEGSGAKRRGWAASQV